MTDEAGARDILERFARLLTYPMRGYAEEAAACAAALRADGSPASAAMARFAAFVSGRTEEEMEELYTRTFDLNPVCALEVGWHLYGEAYTRGAFLVETRRLLRRTGVFESGELPDHLALLLKAVARLDREEATPLARDRVARAVTLMAKGFADEANPYREVIEALRRVLVDRFGEGAEEEAAPFPRTSLGAPPLRPGGPP